MPPVVGAHFVVLTFCFLLFLAATVSGQGSGKPWFNVPPRSVLPYPNSTSINFTAFAASSSATANLTVTTNSTLLITLQWNSSNAYDTTWSAVGISPSLMNGPIALCYISSDAYYSRCTMYLGVGTSLTEHPATSPYPKDLTVESASAIGSNRTVTFSVAAAAMNVNVYCSDLLRTIVATGFVSSLLIPQKESMRGDVLMRWGRARTATVTLTRTPITSQTASALSASSSLPTASPSGSSNNHTKTRSMNATTSLTTSASLSRTLVGSRLSRSQSQTIVSSSVSVTRLPPHSITAGRPPVATTTNVPASSDFPPTTANVPRVTNTARATTTNTVTKLAVSNTTSPNATSVATTEAAPPPPSNSGMDTTVLALAVVGGVVGFGLLVLAGVLVKKRCVDGRRKHRSGHQRMDLVDLRKL